MACAANYQPCLASRCCANAPDFTCQKKLGKSFAQCRPTARADGVTWFQQGKWELVFDACSADNEDCFESRCCRNDGFGCFRRGTRRFAQCKVYDAATCQDTSDWLCPGWQHADEEREGDLEPPPSPPLSPPDEIEGPSCAYNFESCYDEKCCVDAAFGCYKSPMKRFGQCRRYDAASCQDTATWLCPGWEANEHLGKTSGVETVSEYLARVGSLESECTSNYDNCMGTHCCKSAGFRCFEKRNQYYAQCLPPIKCQPSDEFVCNDITGTAISSPPPPMPPHTPPVLVSTATAASLLLSFLLLCSLAVAALVMRRRARLASEGARTAAIELELAEAGAAGKKGKGGVRTDKKVAKKAKANATSDEVTSLSGTAGGGAKKGKASASTTKGAGTKAKSGTASVGKKATKGKSRATAEEAAALNVDDDL